MGSLIWSPSLLSSSEMHIAWLDSTKFGHMFNQIWMYFQQASRGTLEVPYKENKSKCKTNPFCRNGQKIMKRFRKETVSSANSHVTSLPPMSNNCSLSHLGGKKLFQRLWQHGWWAGGRVLQWVWIKAKFAHTETPPSWNPLISL